MDNIQLFLFNAVLTISWKKKFFLKNHFVILRFKLNLKWHITSQNYEFRNSIGHFDTCRNQNKYAYSKEMYDIFLFVIGIVKVT